MRVLFVCLSLSLSLWGAAAAPACTWTDSQTQQRFDFDQLAITETSKWQGINDVGGWNSSTSCTTASCTAANEYQYLFNMCSALAKAPQVCEGDYSLDGAIAVQYQKSADSCHRAARFNGTSTPDYMLLQSGKPSQGFMVTYQSGDTCKTGPRRFTLHLRCSANLPADPQVTYDVEDQFGPMNANSNHRTLSRGFSASSSSSFSSSSSSSSLSLGADSSACSTLYSAFTADCRIYIGGVYEDTADECHYHVNINTVFGCPSSCRIGDTACSNHGICAEDTDAAVTRCFCDNGWGGDQCQDVVDTSTASTSRSPNTVLTVFVLILLFAALGLGYALYRKIRGFHGDFDHQYGQLGDDMQSGKPTRGGIQINTA